MTTAKLLSGLAAKAMFRRKITPRIRRLVLECGNQAYHVKVLRPKNGVPAKYHDNKGGPDHMVLDTVTNDGCPVHLSANAYPVYRSEVVASVELDGELVYMKTKGGGVELMEDPVSWFWVIDEMEADRKWR